MNKALAGFVSS